jgi:hypothetical protein
MDELVNLVAQKTGLAPDKARTAVDTVLGFLKNRVPAPLASQLESALGGGGGGGGLGDVTKGLGGMLGR